MLFDVCNVCSLFNRRVLRFGVVAVIFIALWLELIVVCVSHMAT